MKGHFRLHSVVLPAAERSLAAVLALLMFFSPIAGQAADDQKPASTRSSSSKSKASSSRAAKSSTAKAKSGKSEASAAKTSSAKSKTRRSKANRRKPTSRGRRASRAQRMARTAHMRKAFVASTELRPMAQQLASMRTPEAYAGVTAYARKHTGEAAATAYLALGHAYLLDKRYSDAEVALRQARKGGQDLADFADFLNAQACHAAGDDAAAEELLRGVMDRYPDSIFDDKVPV